MPIPFRITLFWIKKKVIQFRITIFLDQKNIHNYSHNQKIDLRDRPFRPSG